MSNLAHFCYYIEAIYYLRNGVEYILITKAIKKCSYLVVFIILLIATSCYIPIPIHFYEPTSEGKEIHSQYATIGSSETLILDISNEVKSMIRVYETLGLYIGIIVPEGNTVKLASDIFEIHSPELSTPAIARVISIQKMKGSISEYNRRHLKFIKVDNKKVLAPRLEPTEELIGHSERCTLCFHKDHAYYIFRLEYKAPVLNLEEPPKNISVHYPDFYINGELVSIKPINFKWSLGVEMLVDPF